MDEKKVRWHGMRELIKEISTLRFLSVCFLLFALVLTVSSGIDRLINQTGISITPWVAPHFFSNREFGALFGFLVCYMYSDIPFLNRHELYGVIRKGRTVWLTEKLFVITGEAGIVTVLGHLMCVLVFIPHISFEAGWGRIIYTLCYSGQKMSQMNIYGTGYGSIVQNYDPWQAMLISIVLTWAVVLFFGLLMFSISLWVGRIAAMFVALTMAALNYLYKITLFLDWIKYVTPFNWNALGRQGTVIFGPSFYPSLRESAVILICSCLALLAAVMFKCKGLQFNSLNEEV